MRKSWPLQPRLAQLAAEEQIVRDGQRRRQSEILVDRLDARGAGVLRRREMHDLAVQADLSVIRPYGSGERLDEARLAGSVIPDHGQDLAGIEIEIGVVERDHAAIMLDEATRREDRLSRGRLLLRHAESLRSH